MAAGLVAQAKPGFAGEWKIVGDPDSGGGRGGPGIDLIITQSATAMTAAAEEPQGPRELRLSLALSGVVRQSRPVERVITMRGMQLTMAYALSRAIGCRWLALTMTVRSGPVKAAPAPAAPAA
jgi:hypothetical protein